MSYAQMEATPRWSRLARRAPAGVGKLYLKPNGLRLLRHDLLHAPRTGEFFIVTAVLKTLVRITRPPEQIMQPTDLQAGDYLIRMDAAL